MGKKKPPGDEQGLTGKQKARIWRAIVDNIAPVIRAIAILLDAIS